MYNVFVFKCCLNCFRFVQFGPLPIFAISANLKITFLNLGHSRLSAQRQSQKVPKRKMKYNIACDIFSEIFVRKGDICKVLKKIENKNVVDMNRTIYIHVQYIVHVYCVRAGDSPC